jgi:hypothetical protein
LSCLTIEAITNDGSSSARRSSVFEHFCLIRLDFASTAMKITVRETQFVEGDWLIGIAESIACGGVSASQLLQ